MPPVHSRSTLTLLASTVAFSLIGPVARLVPLGAGVISFYRALFAALFLLAYIALREPQALRVRSPKHVLGLLGLGVLLSGTWYFFVRAVQVASITVAVVCLFTYPLMAALSEPLIFRERWQKKYLVGAVLVSLGCALVVGHAGFQSNSAKGAAFGLIAAFCFAAYSMANRRAVHAYPPNTVTLYQFFGAGLLFLPGAAAAGPPADARAWLLLLLLGGVLTTVSQLLLAFALRRVTASFSGVILSLQPALATAFAALLLGEIPTLRALFGVAVIVVAVLYVALARNRQDSTGQSAK